MQFRALGVVDLGEMAQDRVSVGLAECVDDGFDCAQWCVGGTLTPRADWI